MENETPTSAATTEATEPEVMAGITSGEGQPVSYQFEAAAPAQMPRNLILVGAAGLVGLAIATRRTKRRRR
jgi:hypothetical protein